MKKSKINSKCLIMFLCLTVGFLFIMPQTFAQTALLGDVNSDTRVDIIDALLVAQYYVGIIPANFNVNVSDVNSSNSTDILDALLIAQLYVGIITVLPGQTTPPVQTPVPTPVTGGVSYPYVFSCFNDSAASSDLLIYTSNDGLNFSLLADTGYTGPTGYLRDPSIMKHTDGKFYVAFTTPPDMGCCGNNTSFSIASSSDLRSWSTVTTVPCGIAGTSNTWAPEWFKDKDGSIYILASIDSSKTYRYKALNDSLTSFSGPTWIGIGPGYIDTFVVIVNGTYHAFTKNSATYVEHATASSIDGPWSFVGTNDWAGWGNHKEAPCVIDLGNGTWRFYCDAGSAGHEMYSDSSNTFGSWTKIQTLPNVGNSISHGTVIHGN